MARLPPRMRNGYYCVLPLRTCTIILACINLLNSLGSILESELIVFGEVAHPNETLHDDFDLDDYTDEPPTDHVHPNLPPEGEEYIRQHYHIIVISFMVAIFDLAISIADVILSCVLVYGAARRKSAFIRPWLYCGVAVVVYDVLLTIVFVAVSAHALFVLPALFHIPLVSYLWLVAWNLREECLDAEKRAAAASMSMSSLATRDEEACSTPYRTLDEG